MSYRCVATSVAGFVQQLAVSYVTRDYRFYVTGTIPDHKDPVNTDEKIIRQYDLDVSKWTRVRRKKVGLANVQYLRHDRVFVIIATPGEHPFFAAETGQIDDIRRRPLIFKGYAISCRKGRDRKSWHASVRIERKWYARLKAIFEGLAVTRSLEELIVRFRSIPFEPYAPVRDQVRCILRAVNRRRAVAGLEPVPREALRSRRSSVRPFD